jgi:arogenate dehydrogenase (NADP+)
VLLLTPLPSSAPYTSLVTAAVRNVQVLALDAAQPFDFEHRMQHKLSKDKQLTIGIVGFGTFGQFLAKRFVQAGHR